MSTTDNRQLPEFLNSFEDLSAHFDAHFQNLDSSERGRRFVSLAEKLIPLTEVGQGFPPPSVCEKFSHDAGVDLLTAENEDGEILCIQSRFRIREAAEVDSIVSKFKNYESKLRSPRDPQKSLLEEDSPNAPRPTFAVVTASKLKGILTSYRSSQFASKEYFRALEERDRIHFIDGPEILRILQQLYRKAHLLPTAIELCSDTGWLRLGNVRIGTLSGEQIVRLHEQFGDALFFENIRSFLGVTSGKKEVEDRVTVNAEILRTIRESPGRMIERNNGLTFRAEKIGAEEGNVLVLRNGAIVNGCQTTMCLVRGGEKAKGCSVQVKVVITREAWDIAKAANFQNPVTQIDLDLARYLRPQVVHKAANDLGYAMQSASETAAGVIDTVYQNQVEYEEMRCLYLGLFSRRPTNLFENNYAELRADVLQGLYQDLESQGQVFPTLFLAVGCSREALTRCQQTYTDPHYASLFKRFYHEDKPRYRSYLAVLALCAGVSDNLGERETDTATEVRRMKTFLQRVRALLENDPSAYERYYLYAFQVLASVVFRASPSGSESQMAQNMSLQIRSTPFKALYMDLRMRIDADAAMAGHKAGA